MKSIYQTFQWTKIARRRLALMKRYEPLQPHVFLHLSRMLGADTFVDIGANIGAYSILISGIVQHIHAFEPSPATYRELETNVALNGLSDKIITHNVALSDSEKTALFRIINDYSGANALIETSIHKRKAFASEIPVRCMALDDALPEFRGRAACFKIDVEGHELPVLRGAKQTLTKNRCLIQIEHYDERDATLDETLQSYDYRNLLHIGPDHYYSNVPDVFTDKALLGALQEAAAQLIVDLHADARAGATAHDEDASDGL